MQSRMRLTKPTCKPVRVSAHISQILIQRLQTAFPTELDALAVEEEEEPSYLTDVNATPDFVDEAPVEEVCPHDFHTQFRSNECVISVLRPLVESRLRRLQLPEGFLCVRLLLYDHYSFKSRYFPINH